MSWDILPKSNLQYFLQKLKAKFDLKVDKATGKGLSTNDYTTTEKNKLAGIESGAQVNPTIDSALSSTSTNAVQNKIVKTALDGKANTGDIPSVNNKTITIQLNGTTIESFTLNQSSDETINIQVTKSTVGLGNVPNVSTNDQTPTFTEASTRANIASGEKLSVIMGKIKRFFTDLKTVAFTGAYSDLTGLPTIPAAVRVKGNAESDYRTGDVNLTPANVGALALSGGTLTGDVKVNGNVNLGTSNAPFRNIEAYTLGVHSHLEFDGNANIYFEENSSSYYSRPTNTLANDANLPTGSAVVSYLNSKMVKLQTIQVTLSANSYVTPFKSYGEANITNYVSNVSKVVAATLVQQSTSSNPVTVNISTASNTVYLRCYGGVNTSNTCTVMLAYYL